MATGGTAVVTMELQRGVCGDLASIAALADAVVARDVATAATRLLRAARRAAHTVVHCTFSLPADRRGLDLSLPLLAPARNDPDYMRTGSPAAALLPGLGPDPADLMADRSHGLSPFGGTDLAERLETAGIGHLVVCGVSLNVGIPGLVIEAINHGFTVTVASDAVVGLPLDYGDAVLRNTMRYVAGVATVDEVIGRWTDA